MSLLDTLVNGPRVSSEALFKWTGLPSKVQQHLVDVYLHLMAGCLVACLGVYVGVQEGYWSVDPLLTCIAGLVSLIFLASVDRENWKLRLVLYGLFCFLEGLGLSGLVYIALMIDPSTVLTAAVSAVLVFGSFSVAALAARRRSLLYLVGVVSSLTSVMFWLLLANLLFGSMLVYDVTMYLGLAVFVLWVVVDTQMIVEKAAVMPSPDPIMHAVELFIDFVGLFRHILVKLVRDRARRDE